MKDFRVIGICICKISLKNNSRYHKIIGRLERRQFKMKILAFDTSSKTLSVAVLEDNHLLADTTLNIKKNHSISLMPTIDFLMKSLELLPSDLERIVVAHGPGSYTGLRVAVATAKMLAYSLNIELVGVSSLRALCPSFLKKDTLVIPLIDARRQHVYAGFYSNGQSIYEDAYLSIDTVLERARDFDSVVFVGEVSGFKDLILSSLSNAECFDTLPSAYQVGLVGRSLSSENVDTMVPQYLKLVEAEEVWLENHKDRDDSYIRRI